MRWKYAAVLATTGGQFEDWHISPEECVNCRLNPWSCVYACTEIDDEVEFGRSVFRSPENVAVSIIGHELVHTVGFWNQGECEAYTWEVEHAWETGIDGYAEYYEDVVEHQGEECD